MAAAFTGEEDNACQYLEKTLEKEWKAFHKTLANFPHSFQLQDVEQLGEEEKEWQVFHKTLTDFPHSFQLEDVEQLDKSTCCKLLNSQQVDLKAGLSTPLEIARTRNMIGYFHFLLGNSGDALHETEQALVEPGQERNVVSLANKAVMLWQTGNRKQARKQVTILEDLKNDNDFTYLTIKAKAELASTYSCVGGEFCPKAIALFTEVIAEARPPEIWWWKFGFALTQRRVIHMNSTPISTDATDDNISTIVLDTLQEVINNCEYKTIKAKCYSEIAFLLQEKRGPELQTMLEDKVKLTSIEACEKALELDPNDSSVLWKCGRIFRYAYRLDDSVQLLQKSATLRPTTTVFHHLGLTFRSLALRAKKSGSSERRRTGRGGSRSLTPSYTHGQTSCRREQVHYQSTRQPQYQLSKRCSDRSQQFDTRQQTHAQFPFDFSRLSLSAHDMPGEADTSPDSSQHSARISDRHVSPPDVLQQTSGRRTNSASEREIRFVRQFVKSPLGKAEQFNRTDEFVQQALDALEKAVAISKEENKRAVYDLALMHRALGEFDKALELLDKIQLTKQKSLRPFDKINAYEQAGLILKDMSMRESDVRKKKRLAEEGESKLNTALRLCSRLCNKLPGLQHYIQHVWNAFPTLFQAAEQSDRHITDKLLEKARLFSMIKDNYRSMDLLQEIASIAPERADDPDYLKMHIENYVALEQYDQALAFIETLTCTAQRTTMDYFEDPQYVQKVYMKAGKAALLQGTSQDALNKASSYFSAAFADACGDSPGESSSSEDTESADETFGDDSWDMMLLHEESAKSKSEALADIFEKVFGLKVTGMFEDCFLGRLRIDGFYKAMAKSKLVVVLAGGHRLSGTLHLLMGKAAKRPSTVALLIDGNHVPQLIKSMTGGERLEHHMVCPEELLTEESHMTGFGTFPPNLVQKACDVFSFLVNIPFT
ncbi:uncharacterized protein LOC143298058 isoform X2 [Babylonia areolata]|uniref:uncharacterized protein LOC143298058 isoform X2 n=1 Tax=Babylonia areolata TaxID=304850 RepID=UPI003FD6730F